MLTYVCNLPLTFHGCLSLILIVGVAFNSYLEKVVEDLFSHPILKSCCHHVRGEELSVLKVTRNTQTRLHRASVIKKLLQTYSFAHFHYSLLQINVPFKIGMCSPAPENGISERKLQIILSRASWQEITSNFMTDLRGHAWYSTSQGTEI